MFIVGSGNCINTSNKRNRRIIMIDKIADENLPQDLQDSINTFIEQANILERYDLDTIPVEYFTNLLTTLSKHKEYKVVEKLLKIAKNSGDLPISEEPND